MSTFTSFPITGARLSTFPFKTNAPSVTTATSLPNRLARVINVKDDFGAVGDGMNDDTAAIQAAFNAAFGTAGSPHAGNVANTPVYFPTGYYFVSSPLVVTNVQTGIIYGDGPLQSQIHFAPTGGTITPVNSEGFTPVLWLNGFYGGTIRDLAFSGPIDTTTWSTCCIWVGPDGSLGGTGSHGNLFLNLRTTLTTYGIVFGSANAQAVSENTCINCEWGIQGSGHQIGFFVSGGNTLNMKCYGGGCSGNLLAGFKTNNSGTITSIISVAMDGNSQDIDLAATADCAIIGIRTEGGAFVKTGANPTTMLNCNQANQGGPVTGYTTGSAATFTGYFTNISGNSILTVVGGSVLGMRPGMKVYGAGVSAGQTLGLPVAGSSTVWNVTIGQTLGSAGSPVSMTAGSVLILTSIGSRTYVSLLTTVTGTDGTNSLSSGFAGGVSNVPRIVYRPQPGSFIGSIAHVGSNSYFTEHLAGASGEVFPGQYLENSGSTTGVAAGQQIVSATGNPNEWLLSIGFPTQADVGSIAFPVDMKTVNSPGGGFLGVYGISDKGSPGDVGTAGSPVTITNHPVLFEINGSGSVISDACSGTFDSVVKADNNSLIYMRDNSFNQGGANADLFTYSSGILAQFDNLWLGTYSVANLPTPNTGMKGLRMFVTDYNSTITFGSSVLTHGGGSITVPVWCTGTDWVIG